MLNCKIKIENIELSLARNDGDDILTKVNIFTSDTIGLEIMINDLRDYLNNARKNKHSHILTEDEYKLQQNPEFFHSEKEVVELQNANEDLRKRNEELIEKLKAQGISFEK